MVAIIDENHLQEQQAGLCHRQPSTVNVRGEEKEKEKETNSGKGEESFRLEQ